MKLEDSSEKPVALIEGPRGKVATADAKPVSVAPPPAEAVSDTKTEKPTGKPVQNTDLGKAIIQKELENAEAARKATVNKSDVTPDNNVAENPSKSAKTQFFHLKCFLNQNLT